MPDVLISVLDRFSRGILAGTKRIELRRRAPHLPTGTRIWLYSKTPVGSINAVVEVKMVEAVSPKLLWESHAGVLGLTEEEFFSYVGDKEIVGAIHLFRPRRIHPVTLVEMREARMNFHPPQYYARLTEADPILSLLRRQRGIDET